MFTAPWAPHLNGGTARNHCFPASIARFFHAVWGENLGAVEGIYKCGAGKQQPQKQYFRRQFSNVCKCSYWHGLGVFLRRFASCLKSCLFFCFLPWQFWCLSWWLWDQTAVVLCFFLLPSEKLLSFLLFYLCFKKILSFFPFLSLCSPEQLESFFRKKIANHFAPTINRYIHFPTVKRADFFSTLPSSITVPKKTCVSWQKG